VSSFFALVWSSIASSHEIADYRRLSTYHIRRQWVTSRLPKRELLLGFAWIHIAIHHFHTLDRLVFA